MPTQRDVDPVRSIRARAQRHFPPLVLDRDALERLLERAEKRMPPGDVALVIAVRDGPYAGTFASLRDLAADPDSPTRLHDVDISVVRTERGAPTHEVRLHAADGRATLLALGDESWAYGTVGVLSELIAVYAKPQAPLELAPVRALGYFSFGFTLAVVFVAGALRGLPAAVAAALICGGVWFFSDLALAEVRLLLTPPAPEPLTVDIRSHRTASDRNGTVKGLWLGLRLLLLPLWLATAYLVFFVLLPHVPKHW